MCKICNIMHQIACTFFKIFPGVTLPDPYWCWDPDSGPLPSKILTALLSSNMEKRGCSLHSRRRMYLLNRCQCARAAAERPSGAHTGGSTRLPACLHTVVASMTSDSDRAVGAHRWPHTSDSFAFDVRQTGLNSSVAECSSLIG